MKVLGLCQEESRGSESLRCRLRERVASFFDAAADDAAKLEYEGKFIVGLYQLNKSYKDYKVGYYLAKPYAQFQPVAGWQYLDIVWALNRYGENYYGNQ